jgi:hypothetical protein
MMFLRQLPQSIFLTFLESVPAAGIKLQRRACINKNGRRLKEPWNGLAVPS